MAMVRSFFRHKVRAGDDNIVFEETRCALSTDIVFDAQDYSFITFNYVTKEWGVVVTPGFCRPGEGAPSLQM